MGIQRRLSRIACLIGLAAGLLACNLTRYNAEMVSTPGAAAPAQGLAAASTPPAPESAAPNAPAEPVQPAGLAPAQAGDLNASGVKVVYVQDGDLWLWTGGGARRISFLGQAYSPTISPDGALVAFLRPADEFHVELWAVNMDGANERRLVSIADLDAIGAGVRDPNATAILPRRFAWLQGGHGLAFDTQQVFAGPGQNLLEDLHWVDADTGVIKTLFLPGQGGEFAFSPDGARVALSRTDKLLLAALDGSQPGLLMSYTPVVTYSEYHYYARPVWSPDSSFLRVAIPPADPLATPPQPTSLWRLPVDGSQPRQEGAVTTVPFQETPLVYSPDLNRIAYLRVAGEPAENRRELHLATYDGQGDFVYAAGPLLRFFGWSPDGKYLAYGLGEMQELWIGAVDAAPQSYSGAQFGAADLTWANAERFVVVQQSEQTYHLLLADLNGQVVEIAAFSGQPPVYTVAP